MKLNELITAEKVIKNELQRDPTRDIFPITLIKYLLNKKKILDFFDKVDRSEITELQSYIEFDHKKCNACINNQRGMLCRKHTSIERVLNHDKYNPNQIDTNQACIDVDTNVIIYMNEIFQYIDDKLAIIYTPHTKLIQGQLTEQKVKKISSISTYPTETERSMNNNYSEFSSEKLMNMYIKCWFNDTFSLVTVPSGNELLFCLVPNKLK